MLFKPSVLLAGAFAVSALALPTPICDADTTSTALTAEIIIAASPATASCTDAPFPEECADASRAAVAINKSFQTYEINSTGQQAALLAYMLYESGFKYNKNHFPGRPGQGTRMMAMPAYVKLYATSVVGEEAVTEAEAVGGDDGLRAVLALVNSDDEKSFGSAAWLLSSQCTQEVKDGLTAQTVDGWHNFLTECVGTTVADRDTLWLSAKQAMLG
ncbi:hypothetical protein P153DRAFT_364168 [Dothidotthia symphoricarpi CBS 119687]|uniref:Uncharacterized protein n=1 Tax=Dothidotthia symphoricarpi CBS 119687 TaxID=1392245 RepID=A0A6A6AQX7_9PLEO|nr:uncharacterized protein P153DRAFT_364168 [Dothidotthia symphoricarpi CBS 119687]KAF2132911.1 hypothetical protein P153DRAFT_364168 [Dothidotthia symphoricarpi CBS 119687]